MAAILSKAEPGCYPVSKVKGQPSGLHKMAANLFRVKGHCYVIGDVGGVLLKHGSRPRHVTVT